MALAGPITDAVGARWVFAGAAVLAAGAAVVGRALTRRLGVLGEVEPPGEPAPSPTA